MNSDTYIQIYERKGELRMHSAYAGHEVDAMTACGWRWHATVAVEWLGNAVGEYYGHREEQRQC